MDPVQFFTRIPNIVLVFHLNRVLMVKNGKVLRGGLRQVFFDEYSVNRRQIEENRSILLKPMRRRIEWYRREISGIDLEKLDRLAKNWPSVNRGPRWWNSTPIKYFIGMDRKECPWASFWQGIRKNHQFRGKDVSFCASHLSLLISGFHVFS